MTFGAPQTPQNAKTTTHTRDSYGISDSVSQTEICGPTMGRVPPVIGVFVFGAGLVVRAEGFC